MNDSELDSRDIARLLAAGRVIIGAAAWLAPRKFSRAWTGQEAAVPSGTMAMRGLAIRDIALGLGTLMALEGDGPARRWVEAGALADASDAASTLMSWGQLSWGKRLVGLATAGSGCYLGVMVADSVDA